MHDVTANLARRIAVATLAALAACAPRAETRATESGAPKDGEPLEPYRYVYRCEGDFRFAVKVGANSATLYLGGKERVLPQRIAASGTRYEAGGVLFLSKGLLAALETPAHSYGDCVGQPAQTPEEVERMLRPGSEAGLPLEGTEWRLFELNGAPALTPESGRAPMLGFDAASHRVSGFTGCNQLSGSYAREGERLSIGKDLITTRMACLDDALNTQESELLAALPRVTRDVVWGKTLTLYAGEEPVARFTAGGRGVGGRGQAVVNRR